jgi:hypothetical protein
MKFISTKTHGALDYLVGIVLIAAPSLLGFYDGTAAAWTPITLGILTLLYSLLTNYEWGAVKLLTMRTHLTLDFLSGVLLVVSPWLFGFAHRVYVPHVVVGIIEIGAALFTQTTAWYKAGTNRNTLAA